MDSGGLGAHSEETAAAAAAASAGNADLAATAAAATNLAEKFLRRQVSDRSVQFFCPCLGVFSTPGSQSQYNKLDSCGLGAHSEGAAVATAAASAAATAAASAAATAAASAGNVDLAATATAAANLAEKFSRRPKFPTDVCLFSPMLGCSFYATISKPI